MTLKLHQILVVVGRKSLDRRNEMQHCMRVIAYALYVRFPFMKKSNEWGMYQQSLKVVHFLDVSLLVMSQNHTGISVRRFGCKASRVTANNDNPHVKVHVSFQSQGCSYHFDSQQSNTITKFGPTMLVRAQQYAITGLFLLFCF